MNIRRKEVKAWQTENYWRMYRQEVDYWEEIGLESWEYETGEEMMREPEEKWDNRDKKRHKAQHGMQESGRSVKFLERIMNARYPKPKPRPKPKGKGKKKKKENTNVSRR